MAARLVLRTARDFVQECLVPGSRSIPRTEYARYHTQLQTRELEKAEALPIISPLEALTSLSRLMACVTRCTLYPSLSIRRIKLQNRDVMVCCTSNTRIPNVISSLLCAFGTMMLNVVPESSTCTIITGNHS